MDTISITVPTTGTCPAGHPVSYDMPTTVVRGSHGTAVANATCPVHGKPVRLTGDYRA
ncbi:hypothetical protein [Actinosynnema pretiosum]|uniref:hypothetical protein n=1 Tax=Actinosynnema pretiosum TaxID=42197 RepID=UPI0012FD4359|nr:hypothetical protein [Actinosynnema pretiosum]